MKTRRYTLKQRAEQQQLTRERIVDAAIQLHEELGPAATTISALAERAGVQRLTVYRHFPDESAILGACSAKWTAANPPPAVEALGPGAPLGRVRAFVRELYTYYGRTETMWTSLYRDLGKVPALDAPMAEFDAYLAAAAEALLAGWPGRKPRKRRAALRHVLEFNTWASLNRQGLGPRSMADLVGAWVAASTG